MIFLVVWMTLSVILFLYKTSIFFEILQENIKFEIKYLKKVWKLNICKISKETVHTGMCLMFLLEYITSKETKSTSNSGREENT